jgi:hypothetical protein
MNVRALYEGVRHLKCKYQLSKRNIHLLSVNIVDYLQIDVNILGIPTNLWLSQVLPFRTRPHCTL